VIGQRGLEGKGGKKSGAFGVLSRKASAFGVEEEKLIRCRPITWERQKKSILASSQARKNGPSMEKKSESLTMEEKKFESKKGLTRGRSLPAKNALGQWRKGQ